MDRVKDRYSDYIGLDARRALARYRRRRAAVTAVYAAVAFAAGVAAALRWNLAAEVAVIAALGLFYWLGLSAVNIGLQNIWAMDCDPYKCRQVLDLLAMQGRRKAMRGFCALLYARCCATMQDFPAMHTALNALDARKKRHAYAVELVRLNLLANEAFAMENAAGLRQLLDAAGRLTALYRPTKERSRQAAEIQALIEAYLALLSGNAAEARRLLTHQIRTARFPVQALGASLLLGRLDLQQGERNNAYDRLYFAAARGGTTWAAAEARRLLAAHFAPECPQTESEPPAPRA